MESTLYKSIFEKGVARGASRELGNLLADGLTEHLGALDPAVDNHLRTGADPRTLAVWCRELLHVRDPKAAQDLLQKIVASMGQ